MSSRRLTPNERFELWLQTPEMKKAEAALRAIDEFWAERREEGLRNNIACHAEAERHASQQRKERWDAISAERKRQCRKPI